VDVDNLNKGHITSFSSLNCFFDIFRAIYLSEKFEKFFPFP